MNPYSGSVYETLDKAIEAGERREDLVEVTGTRSQVESMSRSIKQVREQEKRRAKNKAARKSRQRSRRR